jgi:hypothetical protein
LKDLKVEFTISEIGSFRFYFGILTGISYGLTLNFLFQLLIKYNNVLISINSENWNNLLVFELSNHYSIITGFLSASLGFCFTSYLWLSKPIGNNLRKKSKKRYAQANSMFVFGLIFMILSRFYYFNIGFVEMTLFNNAFSFNTKEYFGIAFFLLPIFIYFFNWSLISNVFRTKKIILISHVIFVIFGFALSVIKT